MLAASLGQPEEMHCRPSVYFAGRATLDRSPL